MSGTCRDCALVGYHCGECGCCSDCQSCGGTFPPTLEGICTTCGQRHGRHA